MDILAIESSCDETAAAVIRDAKQVSSISLLFLAFAPLVKKMLFFSNISPRSVASRVLLMENYIKQLNSDVGEFCDSFDYRNAGKLHREDMEHVRNSIERAIEFLTSRKPEVK